MTKYSPSLLAYSDIHQVLTAACNRGELSLTFDTPQSATTFVGRANNYRVLLRKEAEARGQPATSPFDHLLISRPSRGLNVTIKPRGFDFIARDASGEIIPLDPTTQPPSLRETLDTLRETPLAESDKSFLDEFEAEFRAPEGEA